MLRPAWLTTSAAAIIAAALFVMCSACGDDDNGSSETATPGGGDNPTPTGGAASLSDIDLASDARPVRLEGSEAEDLLTGTTSIAVGDFNDDGNGDLLVGAPQGDGPQNERPEAGEAYVIFGPLDQSKELASADVTIFGASAGDSLGYAVLGADINDDGKDDVLVGAPGVTAGFDPRTDQGRLYVFYGGSDIDDEDRLDLAEDVFDFTITGAEGFGRLGHAMAAGDVNGDDTGDLVVGAPFAGRAAGSAPGSARTALGEAYVILGDSELTGEWNVARGEYDSLISGANGLSEFASSIAVADVNDDGRDDVIAGAHRASAGDPGRESSGAAYIFYGREKFDQRISAEDGDEDVMILGSERSTFGYPITSGDFNGDETADIAIGAQLESPDGIQSAGAVHIFFGRDDLNSSIDLAADTPDVTVAGREVSEFLPSALTSVDLNGDGRSELVAGSMLIGAADDRFGSGVIYVISISEQAAGTIKLSEDPSALVLGAAAGDRLGNALGAGALGEGPPAVVAVAPLADGDNRADNGIVYVLQPQS